MDVLGRPLKIWKYIHACLKRLPVKAETLFFSQHCSSLKTSMGENVKPQELELDRSIYCDNVTSYTWKKIKQVSITFNTSNPSILPGLEPCGGFAPCSFFWRFGAGGLYGCLGFGRVPRGKRNSDSWDRSTWFWWFRVCSAVLVLQRLVPNWRLRQAISFHLVIAQVGVDFDNFFVWNFSEVPWFAKQWWCSSSSSWEAAEITGAGRGGLAEDQHPQRGSVPAYYHRVEGFRVFHFLSRWQKDSNPQTPQ